MPAVAKTPAAPKREDVIKVLSGKFVPPFIYARVMPLIDKEKGGLTSEAYKSYKEDAEVVAAATAAREGHGKPKEASAKAAAPAKAAPAAEVAAPAAEVTGPEPKRDDVLAILKGEKVADKPAYFAAKALIDPKKGGLTSEAFAAMKTDKEIVAAATAHREKVQAAAKDKVASGTKKKAATK
jgi:hypothetical protein